MGLTPTESEYITLHPERMKDGRIYCQCGASNIRTICNQEDAALIHNICAVCNTILFTTVR